MLWLYCPIFHYSHIPIALAFLVINMYDNIGFIGRNLVLIVPAWVSRITGALLELLGPMQING